MKKRTVIVSIVVIFILIFAGILIRQSYLNKRADNNNSPVVFSNNRMLLELWSRYKQNKLEPNSLRTLDKSSPQNITTSEGQSYTMMRSVWMDDMTTFDKSWQWTRDNLQREDHLMSWKFGQISGDNYGVLTDQGGQNTASDADTDIALALLMASGRWKDTTHKAEAIQIIQSIWEKEVVVINGKPVLVANDIERNNTESVIVNPSYFAPYAYRLFAKADPSHDWNGLVNSSYDILAASQDSTLDKSKSAGLVPDWIRINRTTGVIIPAPEYTSNYGFDALRTPWRLGLDWSWNKEPRAKQVLSTMSLLDSEIQNQNELAAVYSHDGKRVADYGTPAMYGGAMAYFDVVHPDKANDYYARHLVTYYNPDTQAYAKDLSYYDDNWVWFGLAYHDGLLVNLGALING